MSAVTTRWTLAFDCADPHRLAAFWALALGYEDEPGYVFEPAPGEDTGDDGASLVDPDGVLPAIGFLKVPEPKTVKNRLHIDVQAAGGRLVDQAVREQRIRAKVAELVAAGATAVREDFNGHLDHIVMQDPEGNEFCVV